MDLDAVVVSATEFMRRLGADGIAHPGGTLLTHLCRVRTRLADWEARPALQLAGLCHASYGTDGFATALLAVADRARLRATIGDEAEELVYLYAGCDRSESYPTLVEGGLIVDRFSGNAFLPTDQQRRDFAELTAANELDILRESAEFRAQWGNAIRELLHRFRPLLSQHAWRDCELS